MKFKSRKDIFFKAFSFGVSGLFCGFILIRVLSDVYKFLWTDILLLLVIGLLLWLYFGTEYELTPSELRYKSGPIRGKIELENIDEIIEGKSLWLGLKPATARNGLIIKYSKYEEIYISPKTNDTFLEKINELKKNIKITTHREKLPTSNAKTNT